MFVTHFNLSKEKIDRLLPDYPFLQRIIVDYGSFDSKYFERASIFNCFLPFKWLTLATDPEEPPLKVARILDRLLSVILNKKPLNFQSLIKNLLLSTSNQKFWSHFSELYLIGYFYGHNYTRILYEPASTGEIKKTPDIVVVDPAGNRLCIEVATRWVMQYIREFESGLNELFEKVRYIQFSEDSLMIDKVFHLIGLRIQLMIKPENLKRMNLMSW